MKVLWVSSKGYPLRGGAQKTAIAFLKILSKKFDHKSHIYSFFPIKRRLLYNGVKLNTFRDIHELKVMVRKLEPDIIISALDISHEVVRLTRIFNIPCIVYMPSFEYCPPNIKEKKKWKVSPSKDYPTKKEIKFVLNGADAIVVNSHFMKKRFKKQYGINSKVIYPEFLKNDLLLSSKSLDQGDYITGVCGYPYKGSDIFLNLAKTFRKEKFLLVGNTDFNYLQLFRKEENIKVLPFVSTKKFLKMSKILLVSSQWPEPFGRIAVEAMANGIPTLASLTGGLKEIVNCSSLGVREFRNVNAWRKKLEELLSFRNACELNSREGKTISEKFLKDSSTEQLNRLINTLIETKKPNFYGKKVIAFCGTTKEKTAYSSINFKWLNIFRKEKNYSVLSLENPNEFYNLPVDYFVHHDYQHNFNEVSLPAEGKFIAVRTWDFGKFPLNCVEKINEECDQLWVHSNWVKKQAIKSGIYSQKVKVIPLGIDENIFKHVGEKYHLPTEKNFKFIFVGATVLRKGIDILLQAYGQAFSPEEDVCLVIKDHSKDVFYSGIKYKKEILNLVNDKSYPELIYIDKFLSTEELASLYRACDVGVFPYRAEGFSIPILETMACGVPSIVPNFGACLDFCTPSNSFLVPVKRINVPVKGTFMINTLGLREEVEEVDFCEMSVDILASFLIKAFHTSNDELKRKSSAGVQVAHNNFKWSNSIAQIKKHLENLDEYKTPLRLRIKRIEMLKNRKKFEIAKEIFLTR